MDKIYYYCTADRQFSLICNLIGRPRCLGKDFRVIDHKLRIEQIHSILSDTFGLRKRKNIMTLTVISKWLVQNKIMEKNYKRQLLTNLFGGLRRVSYLAYC